MPAAVTVVLVETKLRAWSGVGAAQVPFQAAWAARWCLWSFIRL